MIADTPRQTQPPEGELAKRLDHLFRTVHPKDRGPHTPAEVAEAINQAADGGKVVSGTYLWLLRTGKRDNTRWSRPMSHEDQVAAARAAINERLEREVDPAGELPPDERARRVRSAARALSAKLNAARARKRQRTPPG